jgi:tRNA(Ile2) C34 agmatinyltransferase TiaS
MNINDITTKLYGNNMIDEALYIEEITHKLNKLEEIINNSKPFCPYCKSIMTPFDYHGYYDEHCGWSCNCEKLPNATKWRGSYA